MKSTQKKKTRIQITFQQAMVLEEDINLPLKHFLKRKKAPKKNRK